MSCQTDPKITHTIEPDGAVITLAPCPRCTTLVDRRHQHTCATPVRLEIDR